jgi:hypothetical protein
MKNLIDPPAIVREAEDLKALASQINAQHAAVEGAVRKGLEHARHAGAALIRARKQCGSTQWLTWLGTNVQFGKSTAYRYIQLAENWQKLPTRGKNVSLRQALELIAKNEDGEPTILIEDDDGNAIEVTIDEATELAKEYLRKADETTQGAIAKCKELREIRDGRRWGEQGYPTWQEFCQLLEKEAGITQGEIDASIARIPMLESLLVDA